MPVPSADLVCRFVRHRDWSNHENRPRASAFKDNRGLTVWHKERVRQHGDELNDLLIDHLAGAGKVLHCAGDYESAARAADLVAVVEWRPEDEHVGAPWRKWSNAHAHVEIEPALDQRALLQRFRERLAQQTARDQTPPEPLE